MCRAGARRCSSIRASIERWRECVVGLNVKSKSSVDVGCCGRLPKDGRRTSSNLRCSHGARNHCMMTSQQQYEGGAMEADLHRRVGELLAELKAITPQLSEPLPQEVISKAFCRDGDNAGSALAREEAGRDHQSDRGAPRRRRGRALAAQLGSLARLQGDQGGRGRTRWTS